MSQFVIDVIVTREIVGREQRGFCDASTPKITGQPEIALNCHKQYMCVIVCVCLFVVRGTCKGDMSAHFMLAKSDLELGLEA